MFGIHVISLLYFIYTVPFFKKNPQILLKWHTYIPGEWTEFQNNLIKATRAIIIGLRQISGPIVVK